VALFCSFILYVWIYARVDYQRLLNRLDRSAAQVEFAFKAEQDSTEMRMLQIATVFANDEKVQQLFLLGKKAVQMEGGGAGGDLSRTVRTTLYEHVRQSQEVLAGQFGFRQLHFHLGPGSLSFLRVHRPKKYGDRMDKVRYTIVAANAEQKNTMGFETGRVYSGIRGVTPVFAYDGTKKKRVHVGALEAGTSFATLLSIFQKNRPWLNVAVLLHKKHMARNIWPDFLKKLLKERPLINDYFVEGTTSQKIDSFLGRADFSDNLVLPGSHLLTDGDVHYSLISFPLRDYLGEIDSHQPDAGRVVIWQDISSDISVFHDTIGKLILYGFLLFLVIDFLLFYGLKLTTKGLQKELEDTHNHEAASERARLVAEDSSRLKTEFLSNMSHELRTPMNTVIGLGQLLSESDLDSKQRDFVEKINTSSKSLLNIIEEILVIADLDAKAGKELKGEICNPVQLINLAVEKFSERARSQAVVLKTSFSDGIPALVEGYPVQLEQILNQLVGNAIKFGSGGDVTLAVKVFERCDETIELEFSISDRGIGISEEQQQLIFRSFYQGDSSRTRAYGGTGLGLTIALKTCRQLGSDITVESKEGEGSCFRFQLVFKILPDLISEDLFDAAAGAESSSELPVGTLAEIRLLLQRLDEPLTNLDPKPCHVIANILSRKKWPENLQGDVEQLVRLISQYRFAEAREIVINIADSSR